MCNHIFEYPEDTIKNYNHNGKTLTGICKHCGVKQKSYGRKWMLPIEERFHEQSSYGESQFYYLDRTKIIC